MKKNVNFPGLKNVANLASPKLKAIIYTISTIFLTILILIDIFLGIIHFNIKINNFEIIISILSTFKLLFLSIQQAFNGKNIAELKKNKNNLSKKNKS